MTLPLASSSRHGPWLSIETPLVTTGESPSNQETSKISNHQGSSLEVFFERGDFQWYSNDFPEVHGDFPYFLFQWFPRNLSHIYCSMGISHILPMIFQKSFPYILFHLKSPWGFPIYVLYLPIENHHQRHWCLLVSGPLHRWWHVDSQAPEHPAN